MKTAFLLSTIMLAMVVGLNIRAGRWLPRLVSLVPEAGSSGFYLCLLLVLFAIGISPYESSPAPRSARTHSRARLAAVVSLPPMSEIMPQAPSAP